MNSVRIALGSLFQMPMDGMNYVEYLQRTNTAGKITSRSILEVLMIICTALEEQEANKAQNDANFNQIEEILKKLIAKNGTPTSPLGQSVPDLKIPKLIDVVVEDPKIEVQLPSEEVTQTEPEAHMELPKEPTIRTPKVKTPKEEKVV